MDLGQFCDCKAAFCDNMVRCICHYLLRKAYFHGEKRGVMKEQSHAVYAPVRDVIGWLTTIGHPNPTVMQFVDEYLVDALRWENQAHGYPNQFNIIDQDGVFLVSFDFDTIHCGMQDLNTLLSEVMRDKDASKKIPASTFLLFSVVHGFYDVVNIAGFLRYIPRDTGWLRNEPSLRIGNEFELVSSPFVLQQQEAIHMACTKGLGGKRDREKWFVRMWNFLVSLRNTMSVLAKEPILVEVSQRY